jgi:hypothetical protein
MPEFHFCQTLWDVRRAWRGVTRMMLMHGRERSDTSGGVETHAPEVSTPQGKFSLTT